MCGKKKVFVRLQVMLSALLLVLLVSLVEFARATHPFPRIEVWETGSCSDLQMTLGEGFPFPDRSCSDLSETRSYAACNLPPPQRFMFDCVGDSSVSFYNGSSCMTLRTLQLNRYACLDRVDRDAPNTPPVGYALFCCVQSNQAPCDVALSNECPK